MMTPKRFVQEISIGKRISDIAFSFNGNDFELISYFIEILREITLVKVKLVAESGYTAEIREAFTRYPFCRNPVDPSPFDVYPHSILLPPEDKWSFSYNNHTRCTSCLNGYFLIRKIFGNEETFLEFQFVKEIKRGTGTREEAAFAMADLKKFLEIGHPDWRKKINHWRTQKRELADKIAAVESEFDQQVSEMRSHFIIFK